MDPATGLNKVERLIYPVSAAVTFVKDDIPFLVNGDWDGLMKMEGGYLKEWHPPTFLGVTNALKGPVGAGLWTMVGGWFIKSIADMGGATQAAKLGTILSDSGRGIFTGGVADMLVRPTKYNPGSGAPAGKGQGDRIMSNPLYYERGGKSSEGVALYPR